MHISETTQNSKIMASQWSILVRTVLLSGLLFLYYQAWIFIMSIKFVKWYYFATMWSFFFQTVYLVIAIFTSLLELLTKIVLIPKPLLENLVSHFISPIASFIVLVFWAIFWYQVSTFSSSMESIFKAINPIKNI